MSKDTKTKEQEKEAYSKMVNGNTILLGLEGWIKYVEGFTQGLKTSEKVYSSAVLDCVGEILEYMVSFRQQLVSLLLHCERILQENEMLKSQQPLLEANKEENTDD